MYLTWAQKGLASWQSCWGTWPGPPTPGLFLGSCEPTGVSHKNCIKITHLWASFSPHLPKGPYLESVLRVHEEIPPQIIKHDCVGLGILGVLAPDYTQGFHLEWQVSTTPKKMRNRSWTRRTWRRWWILTSTIPYFSVWIEIMALKLGENWNLFGQTLSRGRMQVYSSGSCRNQAVSFSPRSTSC